LGAVVVSRIFLSHSSANNAEAVALRDWLEREGWKDEIFLDLDPNRGIAAGERWERALSEAANRCEAVLFLVSKAWLASDWCIKEFHLAHRLNKRLFGLLIEDLAVADLPAHLTGTWQIVQLAAGRDHVMLRAVLPVTHEEVHVTLSAEGLQRLKHGLEQAGLDPKHFAWPPASDPNRPPYRGLRPLEAEDAGIFFGRDAPVIEALDQLRGLRETTPPRLLVILGASGSGKSSFLRAGLLPRVKRDDRYFLPLPIIRPGRAVIDGETSLLRALEDAFKSVGIATTRAKLRAAIEGGASTLCPLLKALADKATPSALDADTKPKPPMLILSVDQGEELFLAEGQDEAKALLVLLHDLLIQDMPAIIAVFTIRSDNYERLQLAKELEGLHQETLSLPPMPKGSYAEVIKGPARRLEGTERPLEVDDALVHTLLTDIEAGGAKDALPLLAFTLERLYAEHGGDGDLTAAEYRSLGGITGSIEAAVERAFKAADADPAIPRDSLARLALLRRGLVPWLAGIDPDTGAPRRRVARLSEIPTEARPLIQHLVEQRLLATDVNKDTGENTIEPAHEALLRQWGLLQGWLTEDAALLAVLEGVKRASRDWAANAKNDAWLTHATERLAAAERLSERPDLAANLEPTDRQYIAACRNVQAVAKGRKRLVQIVIYTLLVGIIVGLVGWINQSYIKGQWVWYATNRPFVAANMWPYVLTPATELALKAGDKFHECSTATVPSGGILRELEQGKDYCPDMVVIPAGSFMMGLPASQNKPIEQPQHNVTVAKPFAVSKYELTFDEWDTCVSYGDCPQGVADSDFGRGPQPVINVTWDDAQRYVVWLSKMTGKTYRLLSEAEYEYAMRAGTTTAYSWGDDVGKNNADCDGCGSRWDNRRSAPVGSFAPNQFGLYDIVGNVFEWVEDCVHANYNGAPSDGSAWIEGGNCKSRLVRGGSWYSTPNFLRSTVRNAFLTSARGDYMGFRVGRTLLSP
jgi:formylglycine-generating enzyme required for sulfatase activity